MADTPDKQRAIAEAATPGPWEPIKGVEEADEMRCGVSAVRGSTHYLMATIENGAPGDFCDTEWANALHIATFDPPTVLALLSRLAALEAALAEEHDSALVLANRNAALEAERAAGDARVVELEAALELWESKL